MLTKDPLKSQCGVLDGVLQMERGANHVLGANPGVLGTNHNTNLNLTE